MGHAHSISENPGQIAGIAALSAAIGAITAMLFTPRTGSQARAGIKRRAIHGKDSMMDKMQAKKEDMADTMQDTKDKARDIKDQAKDMKDEAKDTASRSRRNR